MGSVFFHANPKHSIPHEVGEYPQFEPHQTNPKTKVSFLRRGMLIANA
jgi:hypothetical protein